MSQRLAIAIEKTGTKEIVAEHFRRCSKFTVCELDERGKIIKNETYFNPLAGEYSSSCQLPRYVNQFNVGTIIAGGMEQKAVSTFLKYGINVIAAPGLLYKDALNLFMQGKLSDYEVRAYGTDHEKNNW